MVQDAAAPVAGREYDDGFASLDDLLGVDDPASPMVPQTTGGIASGGVNIDPFGEPDATATDSSLDDFLSELQPPPAAGAAAPAPATPGGPREKTKPQAPPAPSSGRLSSSWLDDLLDLENEDLNISPPPGAAASGAATSRGFSPSSPASGILESLIDDVTAVGARDGPRAPAPPAAASSSGGGSGPKAPAPEPADTTAALDDWLNELLDDSSSQGGASSAKSPAAAAAAMSAPVPPVAAEAETTAAAASLEDDPWVLADEGDGGGGGGGGGSSFGDVITGSNQLEGWKASTLNTDAPRRSNVMGRAARRTDAGTGGGTTQERSRPWEQDSGEEQGRSSDWGAGDSWADKGGGSSASWWDKDGPGMGMEEATGRRFGATKEEREVDPIEEAQRACTADLKKLGQRGQWEDATKALVGAKVRGVPLNVYMYNRCVVCVRSLTEDGDLCLPACLYKPRTRFRTAGNLWSVFLKMFYLFPSRVFFCAEMIDGDIIMSAGTVVLGASGVVWVTILANWLLPVSCAPLVGCSGRSPRGSVESFSRPRVNQRHVSPSEQTGTSRNHRPGPLTPPPPRASCCLHRSPTTFAPLPARLAKNNGNTPSTARSAPSARRGGGRRQFR